MSAIAYTDNQTISSIGKLPPLNNPVIPQNVKPVQSTPNSIPKVDVVQIIPNIPPTNTVIPQQNVQKQSLPQVMMPMNTGLPQMNLQNPVLNSLNSPSSVNQNSSPVVTKSGSSVIGVAVIIFFISAIIGLIGFIVYTLNTNPAASKNVSSLLGM